MYDTVCWSSSTDLTDQGAISIHGWFRECTWNLHLTAGSDWWVPLWNPAQDWIYTSVTPPTMLWLLLIDKNSLPLLPELLIWCHTPHKWGRQGRYLQIGLINHEYQIQTAGLYSSELVTQEKGKMKVNMLRNTDMQEVVRGTMLMECTGTPSEATHSKASRAMKLNNLPTGKSWLGGCGSRRLRQNQQAQTAISSG